MYTNVFLHCYMLFICIIKEVYTENYYFYVLFNWPGLTELLWDRTVNKNKLKLGNVGGRFFQRKMPNIKALRRKDVEHRVKGQDSNAGFNAVQ